uniref:Uncharacterized protein n=1 Tax=Caenorhabditis tropicalis TaxID=1561998 RepID=A0A1I7TKB8_9PELO
MRQLQFQQLQNQHIFLKFDQFFLRFGYLQQPLELLPFALDSMSHFVLFTAFIVDEENEVKKHIYPLLKVDQHYMHTILKFDSFVENF